MAANPSPAGLGIDETLEDAAASARKEQQQKLEPEVEPEQKQRRGSWFDRFHKNKQREHAKETTPLSETSSMMAVADDGASVFTTNTTNSRLPLLGGGGGRKDSIEGKPERPKKEKRESMSDRGPFRIEYTPSGLPIAIENKDWPPGVSYKVSSQIKQLQGMGAFYEGKGAIAAGGENAANIGPDPDWVPGLSEEEKKKLRSSKSGNYVF